MKRAELGPRLSTLPEPLTDAPKKPRAGLVLVVAHQRGGLELRDLSGRLVHRQPL